MQKINRKIIIGIIILLLIFMTNTFCFATSSVNTRTRNTSSNNSIENETSENSTNQVLNEVSEDVEDENDQVELSYPEVKEDETKFGPLTMEQVIGGATVLMCFVSIILAISLYSRSREDEEDWEEEYINNIQEIEREEPKAMKELKDEAASKDPKAIEELEDEKKLEEIRKAREEKKEDSPNGKEKIEEKIEKKEDTASLNYRHQQALDDFYSYAEEIKQEKKTKRGKGKHSM